MSGEDKKTDAELKAERELMMAKAALKLALQSFSKATNQKAPKELQEFWDSLTPDEWKDHLILFAKELKKLKQVAVKKILFDIEHYIIDCKRLVKNFNRSKEEILLMVAIGQIKVTEFIEQIKNLPSNKEKLDRSIKKQIKELEWQDQEAVRRLDELNENLNKANIKRKEIESIESEIAEIEKGISARKGKRDKLALKLAEWKARGNIDISSDDNFRLDA